MYPKTLKELDPRVRGRVRLERLIVRSLVNEFLNQGFTLLIDDGGDEFIPASTREEAMDALLNTDEDQLGVVQDGETIGWIKLVYGNDGWDVMSDWHTYLDSYMPKTLALVDKLS